MPKAKKEEVKVQKKIGRPKKPITPAEAELKAFQGEIKPDFTPPVTAVDIVPAFVKPQPKQVEEPEYCVACNHHKKLHFGSADNWCNRCGCLKWTPF